MTSLRLYLFSISIFFLLASTVNASIIDQMYTRKFTQECTIQVNENEFPKCDIYFTNLEFDGSGINATCLEPNVFVLSANRTGTLDPEDRVVPYVHFNCTTAFPLNFDFEGNGALEFVSATKDKLNLKHTLTVRASLRPEATGTFVFYSIANPTIITSFFIFSERGFKPYMVGGTRVIPAVQLNSTSTLIPCVSSDLIANVTLLKQDGDNWLHVSAPYDRKKGFILNSTDPGDYRCFSDNSNTNISENSDYVTVRVSPPQGDHRGTPRTEIKITGTGNTMKAECFSTDNKTIVSKFWNVRVNNPASGRILERCLQRKYPNCGSHTYHSVKTGLKYGDGSCPVDSPSGSCLRITEPHRFGFLYCLSKSQLDDEEEWTSVFYFKGFDNNTYTNVSEAPIDALIKPDIFPSVTNGEFQTDTYYMLSCTSAPGPLAQIWFDVFIKYKNGSFVDVPAFDMSYVTSGMDEIVCYDHLWDTGELVNATVKVKLLEHTCYNGQYKCENGQCITGSYRCDGDRDCRDGSDEHNCTAYHCKRNGFQCADEVECISSSLKCNNEKDCHDGSDETNETCASNYCSPFSYFKCKTGQCIYLTRECDNSKHCLDGSDEDEDHCSKYYPTFNATNTNVVFTPNSINELVCRINQSYVLERFKSNVTWWRRGEELTDPERLNVGQNGLRISLRFDNVNQEDNGEYACVATNSLKRVVQVFNVVVEIPTAPPVQDFSCRSELNETMCILLRCAYLDNECVHPESISLRTTTGATIMDSKEVEPLETGDDGIGMEIFWITFGILLVALVAFVSWRSWEAWRRNNQTRTRELEELNLNGRLF